MTLRASAFSPYERTRMRWALQGLKDDPTTNSTLAAKIDALLKEFIEES